MGDKQSRSAGKVFNKDEAEDELTERSEETMTPRTATASGGQQGISNHPAAEEAEEQAKLPPRGQASE